MADDRKIACSRCRKIVPISDIKYVLSGKDMKLELCSECRGEKVKPATPGIKVVKSSPADANKVTFLCARCKYKFKADPKNSVLKCPYCGKSDKVMEYKLEL